MYDTDTVDELPLLEETYDYWQNCFKQYLVYSFTMYYIVIMFQLRLFCGMYATCCTNNISKLELVKNWWRIWTLDIQIPPFKGSFRACIGRVSEVDVYGEKIGFNHLTSRVFAAGKTHGHLP